MKNGLRLNSPNFLKEILKFEAHSFRHSPNNSDAGPKWNANENGASNNEIRVRLG